jgi:hypothetical protein
MTGRSMLQNRDIDLNAKELPAEGSGNGIEGVSLRCTRFSHRKGFCMEIQSRCRNSRLESRVRENRTHGSEGGEGERPFLPLSNSIRRGMTASQRFHGEA